MAALENSKDSQQVCACKNKLLEAGIACKAKRRTRALAPELESATCVCGDVKMINMPSDSPECTCCYGGAHQDNACRAVEANVIDCTRCQD